MSDPTEPPSNSPEPPRLRRRPFRRTPEAPPELKNAALFTDSRVEIEIDDETGKPQLRIVSGARPKP